jgi:hypothetical protein
MMEPASASGNMFNNAFIFTFVWGLFYSQSIGRIDGFRQA